MQKQKIIIIEDDEITSLHLNMSLQKHGYSVVAVCDNLPQAINKIQTNKPEIAIIDISLQESNDGLELAKIIKRDYNIPFIYLTSYSDDDMIEQAKLTEPYGYIVKPFDPASLHATIQMALFQFEMQTTKKTISNKSKYTSEHINDIIIKESDVLGLFHFGDLYYYNTNENEFYYKKQKIKLTRKEKDFLRLLIVNLGTVVSFEEARSHIWPKNDATLNSVRTLIWRLRNKLETDLIQNSSGEGYIIEKE